MKELIVQAARKYRILPKAIVTDQTQIDPQTMIVKIFDLITPSRLYRFTHYRQDDFFTKPVYNLRVGFRKILPTFFTMPLKRMPFGCLPERLLLFGSNGQHVGNRWTNEP